MGDSPSPRRTDWTARVISVLSNRPQSGASDVVAKTVAVGGIGFKTEEVRLALRIVLHLAQTGPLQSGDVALQESTQRGIASQLGVTQGAISKVLKRLVAAGVVRSERHHVRGERRRMRAHSLTVRGAEIARRYWERFSGPVL